MPLMGDYEPSQNDRTRDQVELYEATNGVEGGTLNGKPVIVLTYKGAKSGKIPYRVRAARAGREIPVLVLQPLRVTDIMPSS